MFLQKENPFPEKKTLPERKNEEAQIFLFALQETNISPS